MRYRHSHEAGFSLIEVLIAIVILSIGLLGMAGLQTRSLRDSHSAYLRTQASTLANDLIDRMRANRDSATTGVYDIATATSTAPTASTNCATTSCTAAQVAAYDLNEWVTRVTVALPLAQVKITRAANATTGKSDIVTISIAWDDSRSGSASETFLMSAQI